MIDSKDLGVKSAMATDHGKRVVIKTFPHIKFLIYQSSVDPEIWVFKLMATVTCIETGKPLEVGVAYNIPMRTPPTKEDLTDAVRSLFEEHIRHEFEEGLRIDGETIFTPHNRPLRTPMPEDR